jgi:hypothetical protein
MHTLSRYAGLFVAGLFLILATGCDSGDGVEVTPEDVEGTYSFLEFTFVPNAARIPSVDARESLVEDETFLRLFGSGQAQLLYDFEDGPSGFLDGQVSLSESTVTVELENSTGARDQLLLPATLRLDRESADVLTTVTTSNGERSGFATTANLELFDPDGFEGLTSVSGELFITLER